MGTQPTVSLSDVQDAADRLSGHIHTTPVMRCQTLDEMSGRQLFFKCENVQKVGAFKFRGATNAVLRLSEPQAAAGVVAHSSGNHAQALALAAKNRGIRATLIMPSNATAAKRAAVEGYGARVVLCAPNLAAREEATQRVLSQDGGVLIHPYDHPDIIAGQGTLALEFMAQVPDLDAMVAPVGGGGLMAGLCVAVRGTQPWIRILAVEPSGADDFARSLADGVHYPQVAPNTVADGLLTSVGVLNWPILRDQVDEVLTVCDAEIVAAMRLLWERAKWVVEPSGAVALAGVLSTVFRELDGLARVGVVISGGNADLDNLPWMSE